MIRKTLHDWIAAAYRLPVVEDITQTKVEQAISFSLENSPVLVRVKSDDIVKFNFDVTIQYRCPNGFPGIGFLTMGLIDADNQPPGFNLVGYDGAEIIDYQTKTEMIISKVVSGFMEVERNKIRELIKCVDMVGGLECHSCGYVPPIPPEKFDFNQKDFKPGDFA